MSEIPGRLAPKEQEKPDSERTETPAAPETESTLSEYERKIEKYTKQALIVSE